MFNRRPDCRLALTWTWAGSPRFPGDPSHAFASVQDPGRTDDPSPIDGFVDAAPAPSTAKASAYWRCRGYRAASASAAYASRMVLPTSLQDLLPAGWLAFTGRELNPLDRYKRFQITFSFPFSGFILAQRRTYLHLSYSYAAPCGPALLVSQDPTRKWRVQRSKQKGWNSRTRNQARGSV